LGVFIINKEYNGEDNSKNNNLQVNDIQKQVVVENEIKLPKLILFVLFIVWISYAAIYITSVTAVPKCSLSYYILLDEN
jgi:hypothetical protein